MENKSKNIEKELFDKLFVILNSQKLCAAYVGKGNFQEIIEKQANTLYFLEVKNKSKHTKSAKILARYNALTNKSFEIDKNFKYDDFDSMIDDIHYLSVYYKNIMNIDLDDFVKQHKSDIEKIAKDPNYIPKGNKEKIDSNDQTVVNNANTSNQNKQQNQNKWGNNFGAGMGNMAGMNGGMPNMGNFPPQQNPYFIGMAQSRISKEIKEGKIFAYTSQPKIIPIMKVLVSSLIFLLGLLCIILSIFMGLANGVKNTEWTNSTTGELLPYSTISNCVMYGIFSLVFIFVSYWLASPLIPLKKKQKNNNEIYYFAWQLIAIFGVFFVISLIMGIFFGGTSTTIFSYNDWARIPANEGTNILLGLTGWYWTYIIMFAVSGLIIVSIVISAVYNPKKDLQKINLLMKQYIDEIVASQNNI